MAASSYIPYDSESLDLMIEQMVRFVKDHCTDDPKGEISHRILMGAFRSFLRLSKIDLDVKPGIFKATMMAVMDRIPEITRTEDPVVYHGLVISDPTYVKPKWSKTATPAPEKSSPGEGPRRNYERILRFYHKHCVPAAGATIENHELFERFNADAVAHRQPKVIPSELKAAMQELMEIYPITRQESPVRYTGFQVKE